MPTITCISFILAFASEPMHIEIGSPIIFHIQQLTCGILTFSSGDCVSVTMRYEPYTQDTETMYARFVICAQ